MILKYQQQLLPLFLPYLFVLTLVSSNAKISKISSSLLLYFYVISTIFSANFYIDYLRFSPVIALVAYISSN